jgi:hypothetical protein
MHTGTVLSDQKGKKRKGKLNCLIYLLQFLDAYDFGGDASGEIQEENKPLISATVLGLIFEKINGYKDGAYFTPGFVTMYICREAIRNAVVKKFNSAYEAKCKSLREVYEIVADKQQANEIVESIRICDPAVGSGHFLVSALNELIAIKSELKILCDKDGRSLRDYNVEVVGDELVITDDDGNFFEYRPHSKESQRVQETLFHEKQRLIENCLFGVDINRNSVKICRLRLWIELLKHSYYVADADPPALETLPNIDINIGCGDSLVSRFELDENLGNVLRNSKRTVSAYRDAVHGYQSSTDKLKKKEFERLISDIKHEFTAGIGRKSVDDLRERLRAIEDQKNLFAEGRDRKVQISKEKERLQLKIEKAESDLEDLIGGQFYRSAFEWRFEFPGVLNDKGSFVGFDVVLANPPYGVSIKGEMRNFLVRRLGKVPDYEIYYLFLNLCRKLANENGTVCVIVPNSVLFNVYAKGYRELMLQLWQIEEIVDCSDFVVFADATVRNVIFLFTGKDRAELVGKTVRRPSARRERPSMASSRIFATKSPRAQFSPRAIPSANSLSTARARCSSMRLCRFTGCGPKPRAGSSLTTSLSSRA